MRLSSGQSMRGGKAPMIDLNTATAAELDEVPALKGHGFEIVRYRDDRGRFSSLRQLDEVPGLCGKTDGIGDSVSVGGG